MSVLNTLTKGQLGYSISNRTLIFRELKGLQDYIDVTTVDPIMLENGWELTDPLYGFEFTYQLYLKANPNYEGRVTVPILWDKHTETIVSNESSEIIRMFNTAFNHLTGNQVDYYPDALRSKRESRSHCQLTQWLHNKSISGYIEYKIN